MMDLFYLGVPVSHEGVTVNQYEKTPGAGLGREREYKN